MARIGNQPYRRPVTLRDVAAQAGVDVSTVSRALRRDPRITAATRERVESVARAMGYRPNPYVTALVAEMRARRPETSRATIAVLDTGGDEGGEPSWSRGYLDGIVAEAGAQGFSIDILRLGTQGLATPGDVGRVLRARGIRGLVVMPVSAGFSLRGIPFEALSVATIDPSLRTPRMNRAMPDYFQGMQLALGELHRLGRRRIGFCTSRGEMARIGKRWLGGYLAWQRERPGIARLDPHFASNVRPLATARQMAAQWRRMRDDFVRWLDRERPDAIVSNFRHIPLWLEEVGIAVPRDVAFASLGCGESDPQPGIDQRSRLVGAAALNLVSSQIYRNAYGPPDIPTTVLVPSVWRPAGGRRKLPPPPPGERGDGGDGERGKGRSDGAGP